MTNYNDNNEDDELTPYELDMPAPAEDQGPSTFKPNPAAGGQSRPGSSSGSGAGSGSGSFTPRPKPSSKPASSGNSSSFQPSGSGGNRPRPESRGAGSESKRPRPDFRSARDDADDDAFSFSPKKSRNDKYRDDDDDRFEADGGPTLIERILYGKVGTKQLSLFYRQLSQYLLAGMDVPQSLKGLQKQFRAKALGPVIARMIDGVKTGRSLTEVFEREPQAFDRLAVNMIHAAESRGAVPEILVELAEIQEFRARTVRNIASASIYPILVLSAATICLLIIAVFVGPLFNSVLGDMIPPDKRGNLILPTRLLFKFNEVLMILGPLMPIFLLIGVIVGVWLGYKTKTGQTVLDEIYWYVPVFGKIQKYVDLSRMGRMLGALLESGVSTPEALALTAGVVRLKPFERALLRAEQATREGDEMGPVFAESGRFPYEVVGLIETGETTGKLPYTLQKIGTDFEERATMMIKNLSTLIQPMITIGLGLIVGFIAIAFVGLIAGLYSGLAQGF